MIEVFNMYTQSLPNMHDGVMHNHDIVKWEKNISQFGRACCNMFSTN